MPKYKMTDDGKGIAINDNGLPIIIADDGSETGVDAIHLVGKILEVNNEAKKHRLNAEEATEKLAKFTGIEDPEAAITAMETVKNLDAKQLVDAGEAKKVKDQAVAETKKVYEDRLADSQGVVDGLQSQVFTLMVSDKFKSSKVIGTTVLPPDVAEAYFGKNFKVEEKNGKTVVVGYMGDDPIYSKERPGELATFEEALGTVIDQYPMKNDILKGSGGHGSGKPANGGGGGGEKIISRAAFEQKGPAEKMEFSKSGGQLTD